MPQNRKHCGTLLQSPIMGGLTASLKSQLLYTQTFRDQKPTAFIAPLPNQFCCYGPDCCFVTLIGENDNERNLVTLECMLKEHVFVVRSFFIHTVS